MFATNPASASAFLLNSSLSLRDSFRSARRSALAAFSRAPCTPPPVPPNAPPATAPRTALSMMRSNSLLPNISGLSSMSRSAAMLIASCAPSVTPSNPRPLASPTPAERSTLGFMPDFSNSFLVASALTGAEIFLAIAAGRIESNEAAAAPNNKAVPGANSPVSW